MPVCRHPACARLLLTLALTIALCSPAAGDEFRPELRERRPQLIRPVSPELPLAVRSEERGEVLWAEVVATLEVPFSDAAAALADPAAWCDIVPLTFNVKACTWQQDGQETLLAIFAGRKHYEPPEEAVRLEHRFLVEQATAKRLRVILGAPEGPLGIRDSRIELEATPTGGGTVLRLVSSFRPSLRSRLATDGYLATLGRNKVGFTVTGKGPEGPRFVGGVRGMIERNAMRYFLALQAFLDTRHLAPTAQFEARLRTWFRLCERFRPQLHEMEEAEYLAAKRRERRDQVRLQQDLP